MKNYFKFMVVVAGLTLAAVTSFAAQMKRNPGEIAAGTCSSSAQTCGKSVDGQIIYGDYIP